MHEYELMPSDNNGVRNVEVTAAEQSFFSVGFDDLKTARKAALVATEYGDFVESNLRNNVNNILDEVLSEIDSIVARRNKENVGKFKKDSAISQKLSDDDKAAINQIYSANINGIIGEIRNIIIDAINAFNGDDDGEVKEDFATFLRRFEESGGDENAI